MAKKKNKLKATVQGQKQVSAEVLPRRTLQDSESVISALYNEYAGKEATWEELAKILDLSPKSNSMKYLMWAAQAYGLIGKDGSRYSLSETGRKIVAPTFEGEDLDARVKALLTPSLLSKFYTDYNGHPIPSPQHFSNVLETKYQIPRDRVEEAKVTIIENAKHANILENRDDSQFISLKGIDIPSSGLGVLHNDESEGPDTSKVEIDWDKVIFVITPIGDEASEVRKHADMILKHLLEVVAEEFKMKVIRADKIEKSGLITKQIFEHLFYSRLCIADLSFNNPNAFYELGVRHVTKRPTIQMIRKGDRIPFDVSQGRTIIIDTSDVYTIMDRFESSKRELREHVKVALSGDVKVAEDNPVQNYLPDLKIQIN